MPTSGTCLPQLKAVRGPSAQCNKVALGVRQRWCKAVSCVCCGFVVVVLLWLDAPPWNPLRGTAIRGTAQNFALFSFFATISFLSSLFFSSFLPQCSFLSSLSWRSSRLILVVFEAPGPSNVHVRSSRVSCETLAARELRTCTIEGPGASNTTKFHEKNLKRRKKGMTFWQKR